MMLSSYTHYNLNAIKERLHFMAFTTEHAARMVVHPHVDAPSAAFFLSYMCHFRGFFEKFLSQVVIQNFTDDEKMVFLMKRIISLSTHYGMSVQKLGYTHIFSRGDWSFDWDTATPYGVNRRVVPDNWVVTSDFVQNYVVPEPIVREVPKSEPQEEKEENYVAFDLIAYLEDPEMLAAYYQDDSDDEFIDVVIGIDENESNYWKNEVVLALVDTERKNNVQGINLASVDEIGTTLNECEHYGQRRLVVEVERFLLEHYDKKRVESFVSIVMAPQFLSLVLNQANRISNTNNSKRDFVDQGTILLYFYRLIGCYSDNDSTGWEQIAVNFMHFINGACPGLDKLLGEKGFAYSKWPFQRVGKQRHVDIVDQYQVSDYFIFSLLLQQSKYLEIREKDVLQQFMSKVFSIDEFEALFRDLTSVESVKLTTIVIDSSILRGWDKKKALKLIGRLQDLNYRVEVAICLSDEEEMSYIKKTRPRIPTIIRESIREKKDEFEEVQQFIGSLTVSSDDTAFCAYTLYVPPLSNCDQVYGLIKGMLDRSAAVLLWPWWDEYYDSSSDGDLYLGDTRHNKICDVSSGMKMKW